MAWVLNAGQHVIHIPQEFVDKQMWCSYVPIDGKCCVSTTGFKWDLGEIFDSLQSENYQIFNNFFLDNHVVQFGGMVSTSNTYSSNVVTLQSDGLLYWSMGITENES